MLITRQNEVKRPATPPNRAPTADRFEELRSILNAGRYFKLVCAAGNRDAQAVRRLSLLYTLGGATGIDAAFALAPSLQITIPHRPFISVGLPGDPHVRKSTILEDACPSCGECYENCDDQAISDAPHEVDANIRRTSRP